MDFFQISHNGTTICRTVIFLPALQKYIPLVHSQSIAKTYPSNWAVAVLTIFFNASIYDSSMCNLRYYPTTRWSRQRPSLSLRPRDGRRQNHLIGDCVDLPQVVVSYYIIITTPQNLSHSIIVCVNLPHM